MICWRIPFAKCLFRNLKIFFYSNANNLYKIYVNWNIVLTITHSPNGCRTDEEIKINSSTKYHFDVILILNYLHYPFINAGRFECYIYTYLCMFIQCLILPFPQIISNLKLDAHAHVEIQFQTNSDEIILTHWKSNKIEYKKCWLNTFIIFCSKI